MRSLTIAAVLGAACLCHAPPVTAYSFKPAGAAFTLSGDMSFSGGGMSVDCKAIFAATTDADGLGHIAAVSFSGGALGICGAIHALALPWAVKAADPRHAVVSNIAVRAPLFGDCGARDVPILIARPGAIHFDHVDLPPRCVVHGGDLTTKPIVTIADP